MLPSKNSHLFSKKKECNDILKEWQTSFSTSQKKDQIFLDFKVSQTSFGHISTNSLTILTVLMATESPWKDLSIDTSYALKQSVLAEILGRLTSNCKGTTLRSLR